MKDLGITYTKVEEGKQLKGCIARMVTQRKVNICKSINKSAETTHQLKIRVKRTKEETNIEGKRKPRPQNCFSISGQSQDWYFLDGRDFNIITEQQKEVKKLQEKVDKLNERLEEEIKNNEDMVSQDGSHYIYLNFF